MVPHWLPLLTHLKPSETEEGGPFERESDLPGGPRRCEWGRWIGRDRICLRTGCEPHQWTDMGLNSMEEQPVEAEEMSLTSNQESKGQESTEEWDIASLHNWHFQALLAQGGDQNLDALQSQETTIHTPTCWLLRRADSWGTQSLKEIWVGKKGSRVGGKPKSLDGIRGCGERGGLNNQALTSLAGVILWLSWQQYWSCVCMCVLSHPIVSNSLWPHRL